MVEGQEVGARVHVVCETATGHADLRLYGPEGLAVPWWWIGLYDRDGALCRTWIANEADLAPTALLRWLRPIVGYEAANRLVNMAFHEHSRPERASAQPVALR